MAELHTLQVGHQSPPEAASLSQLLPQEVRREVFPAGKARGNVHLSPPLTSGSLLCFLGIYITGSFPSPLHN